jgi:glycosyltransferase involved in cell wall biosynthesis
MTNLISICIPTYNRPDLLREALDSCFAQTYSDYEILIGDDSKNDDTEHLMEQYRDRYRGLIHYQRNKPSLGQAGNVNDLFRRAGGDRLVLLHDDDTLLPEALEWLSSCWNELPTLTAAFGKQYMTDHQGNIQMVESESLNRTYHRTANNSGQQTVPAVPGLLRMFPNDAYMVITKTAREIGYRPPSEVGEACDTDFGVRLCVAADSVWFLDEYTAKYRNSEDAISKISYLQPFAYSSIEGAAVPTAALPAKRIALQGLAPAAVSGFARLGQPGRALGILLSSNYRLNDKLHPRAAYHSYLIFKAYLRRLIGSEPAKRA